MTERKTTQRNEGEGNRTAARTYNKAAHEHAESGKVDQSARDAREALDGAEGEELREAEKAGKARAKEVDPAVDRDYRKGRPPG